MDAHPDLKAKDLVTAERLFYVSLALFLAFMGGVGYVFWENPTLGKILLGAFFANAFGGRAAGVGLCIAFDVDTLFTVLYNLLVEVLIVMFCFSLFLFSLNNAYLRFAVLRKGISNAARNAIKYEAIISKYGWIGIFSFVMIPLPVTGPVVGSFLAYFLNFGLKKNFMAVFSGTFAAIVIWSLFFEFLVQHISKIQGVLAVIAIAVVVYFFKHIRNWFVRNE